MCVLVYHRDVEKDLVSDTSGDFRKLMVALSAVSIELQS